MRPRRRVAPVWAVIVKEFIELRRDRRSMALVVVLPILFLVVFGYAANFNLEHVKTELVGPGAVAASKALPPQLQVSSLDPTGTRQDAERTLRDNKADVAVVTSSGTTPVALFDGSELFATQTAVGVLAGARPTLKTEILFNPDLKTSWVMVPALAGLIMAFIGTIITSLGLVRERQAGTLEQLAVMPLTAADVIGGKVVPYFVLACLRHARRHDPRRTCLRGPIQRLRSVVFALGALLFVFVVLGIGVFISTVSENQGQAIQTAILFLLPGSAVRHDLPARRDAVGDPLDRLCAAADLLHRNRARVMLRAEPFASLWPASRCSPGWPCSCSAPRCCGSAATWRANAGRAKPAPSPAPAT